MNRILSMTGFASAQVALGEQASCTLTVKSVNHRFLDLQLRLPAQCDALEVQMRRVLKERLKRGHIEVTLHVDRMVSGQMQVNAGLLEMYVQAYRDAAAVYGVGVEMDLNGMLRMPGVMAAESGLKKEDLEGMESAVIEQLGPLLDRLNEGRAQEGAVLGAELRRSMERLEGMAGEVAELRSGARKAQLERLRGRMAELTSAMAVSDERLLAEAALLSERSDIEEEVVRLRTHVERFVALLEEGGEVGKRLDFLSQELNREANTMLSKTSGANGGNGLRITDLGLEMKVEIERAREQVQNLE